jgi:hypothetical protein
MRKLPKINFWVVFKQKYYKNYITMYALVTVNIF